MGESLHVLAGYVISDPHRATKNDKQQQQQHELVFKACVANEIHFCLRKRCYHLENLQIINHH